MSLDTKQKESVHRLFAKKCHPPSDALLAAHVIFIGVAMDGPTQAAAKRLITLFTTALAVRHPDTLAGWVADLRAFTLARHAAYWTFLMQMYGSTDALDDELDAYLHAFAPALDGHMATLVTGGFQPTIAGDDLLPWATALSLHGRFWVDGLERKVPEAQLMKALWSAPAADLPR